MKKKLVCEKAPMVQEPTKESLEEILLENSQLTESNKALKETADKIIDENEELKESELQRIANILGLTILLKFRCRYLIHRSYCNLFFIEYSI